MNNHNPILILLLAASCAMPAAQAADADAPESAIRALEDAYRRRDIEAAVAAKDFAEEARLMLRRMNPDFARDESLVRDLAGTLELAYRKELGTNGFPRLDGAECSFPARENLSLDLVKVTEECAYRDGRKSRQKILVKKGKSGWRVLNVTD